MRDDGFSPEVVVHGDEGHQAGDRHRGLVLLVHGAEAKPEEECGCHHGGQGEREAVVDQVAEGSPLLDFGLLKRKGLQSKVVSITISLVINQVSIISIN